MRETREILGKETLVVDTMPRMVGKSFVDFDGVTLHVDLIKVVHIADSFEKYNVYPLYFYSEPQTLAAHIFYATVEARDNALVKIHEILGEHA